MKYLTGTCQLILMAVRMMLNLTNLETTFDALPGNSRTLSWLTQHWEWFFGQERELCRDHKRWSNQPQTLEGTSGITPFTIPCTDLLKDGVMWSGHTPLMGCDHTSGRNNINVEMKWCNQLTARHPSVDGLTLVTVVTNSVLVRQGRGAPRNVGSTRPPILVGIFEGGRFWVTSVHTCVRRVSRQIPKLCGKDFSQRLFVQFWPLNFHNQDNNRKQMQWLESFGLAFFCRVDLRFMKNNVGMIFGQ